VGRGSPENRDKLLFTTFSPPGSVISSAPLADRQSVESSRDSAPCFSVVIPAHNSAAFISEALESVRAQTFQDFEVIVVDDGSTDNTWQAIQGCAGWFPGRFCSIRVEPPQNKGPAGARNLGIRQAKGEFVAFLDSDDLWVPEHLAHAYDAFHSHKEAGVFVGQGDLGGNRLYHSIRNFTWPGPRPQEASSQLLRGCYFPLPSLCVRRDLLLALGGFREDLVCNEDWLLYLFLWKRTLFVHSPTVECQIRRREESASGSGRQMSKAMYRDWIKAYLILAQSGMWANGELQVMRDGFIRGRAKDLADYLCGFSLDQARWMVGAMLQTGLGGRRVWLPVLQHGFAQFLRRGIQKARRSLTTK